MKIDEYPYRITRVWDERLGMRFLISERIPTWWGLSCRWEPAGEYRWIGYDTFREAVNEVKNVIKRKQKQEETSTIYLGFQGDKVE